MTTSAIPDRGQGAWNTIADEYLEEIIAARGTAASLNARISVTINEDGTAKSPIPASGWWTEEPDTIAFVSANSFTVSLDKTAIYTQNRAIKATVTAGTVYSHVVSSSYDSVTGTTTVTIRDSVLDSGLSAVYYGQDPNSDAYVEAAVVPLGGKTGGDLKVDIAGNDVTIKPGYREVGGKWYHWNSEITFTIGPAGSNPDSDAVPTSADMVYLYIDASSLPSDNTTELTAANFISKVIEPAFDSAKHGFYDGDDRLIGVLRHDGTNLEKQFKRGNRHIYTYMHTEVNTTYLDQVVTFSNVPANGVAVAVDANLYSSHSIGGYKTIAVYPVDSGGVKLNDYTLKSVFYSVYLTKFNAVLPFGTAHNKLWIYMPNSDTTAGVNTAGFVYHECV